MKKSSYLRLLISCAFCAIFTNANAQINNFEHYNLSPELLDQLDPPNIMIVFDNSGSMTWSLAGFGLNGGASNVNSRSYIARTAMQQVFNSLQGTANLGLSVYNAASCGSSGNNWGSLRANITPFDATANANFQNLLATEDNSNAQAPGIIRSGGCTPIAATLDTVQDYVTGTLAAARNQTGGAVTLPPNLQCSATDAVILVSDGSANGINPNIGCNSNNATTCSTQKVTELETLGWETYVVGFGGAPGLANNLNAIAGGASDDETGLPRQFFPAANGAQLVAVFNDILGDIFKRTSSGSAAAVSASSTQDVGFFVQSLYRPIIEGDPHDAAGNPVAANSANAITEEAYWAGISRMLFLDPFGFVREDTNQNDRFDLADYGTSGDRAIRIEISSTGETVFRRLTIDTSVIPPVETGQSNEIPLAQLNSLWNLSETLGDFPNNIIKTQRQNFNDTTRRLILTNINGQKRDLTWDTNGPDSISPSEIGYLGLTAGQDVEASNIINWTRGYEDFFDSAANKVGKRNRTVFTDTPAGGLGFQRFLYGDPIHSTPVIVGPPNEAYFELYGDSSYKAFRDNPTYKNRRTVAYVGSNDGMIHAVNTGVYNTTTRSFNPAGFPLGFELWAYVPESILPHLRFLSEPTYNSSSHIYGVDGPIIAEDVKVDGQWRTYLFASTGYGGFEHDVDTNLDGVTNINDRLHPSVVILDVTNPDQEPRLVAEVSDPEFGTTTVRPAVFQKDDGTWAVAIGTGPSNFKEHSRTENGKIFVYDLGLNGVSSPEIKDTGKSGFIGDIAAFDWNFNTTEFDALYFGVNGDSADTDTTLTNGSLNRITLYNGSVSESKTILDGYPFDNLPRLLRDRDQGWIFAGSGRVNSKDDFATTEQNLMVGILEEFDANTGEIDTSSSNENLSLNDLINTTDVRVQLDGMLVSGTTSDLPSPPANPNATGEIDTFTELEAEIAGFSRGWYRETVATGSRVPGRATFASDGILTYITYTPGSNNANQCSIDGQSDLNVLSAYTGTAPFSRGALINDPSLDPTTEIEDTFFVADTLVYEATPAPGDKEQAELEIIGPTPPCIPGTPGCDCDIVLNPQCECIPPEANNLVCAGADGTNPACAATLPPICGFGQKSYREIDFRFY